MSSNQAISGSARHVEFFDSYPFSALRERLLGLAQGAVRCEIAVAFLTGEGCTLIQELRDRHKMTVDVVVSVSFPTDLVRLCRLSQQRDIRVWLHTGYSKPTGNRERGQFHSKLVIFYYPDDRIVFVVGSHNWTGFGLDGVNLEASLIVDTVRSDDVAVQARNHFRECRIRSHRFDDKRLLFYQTIQHKLHIAPGSLKQPNIPGFEELNAVVIHAEYSAPGSLPSEFRLYIPASGFEADFFPRNQTVLLFVHQTGLFSTRTPVTQKIKMFLGTVTMNNSATDAAVEQRSVEYQIDDLTRPSLTKLGGNIPQVKNEAVQIVVRFEDRGEIELPIFHSSGTCPSLKAGKLQERRIDRDKAIAEGNEDWQYPVDMEWPIEMDHIASKTQQTYTAPQELFFQVILRLPTHWLYPKEIESRLLSLLYSRRLIPESESPKIRVEQPEPKHVLSEFVCRVFYQMTDESIAQAPTQSYLDLE